MIKLIPIAGEGSRFKIAGYELPKPMLPVSGKPMVIQAANSLPPSDKNIFVLRDFHISTYGLDSVIKSAFPNCEILQTDGITEGQAVTCLFARNLINNNQELIIGAGDNGMIYDIEDFKNTCADSDAVVFTFRNNRTVVQNPKSYGWVLTDTANRITEVRVKYDMPDPMNAHAIVGAFWFKQGSCFVEAAENMLKRNGRINNEFYVDECINDLLALGKTVRIFEVKQYICWGTPDDYMTFNYWESFFEKYSDLLKTK